MKKHRRPSSRCILVARKANDEPGRKALNQHHPLILASQSSARQSLLKAAHLDYDVHVSQIDEDAEKDKLSKTSATDVALKLAQLKATSVSAAYPDIMVIVADQTMECNGQLYDKPAHMAAARDHLLALSGKTHTLYSAVAIARNEQIIWRHVAPAHLHMRALGPNQIDEYLAATGDIILSSVGCYRLEDAGARLFETIDGDYFTILGMPLLPLLAYLREAGAID